MADITTRRLLRTNLLLSIGNAIATTIRGELKAKVSALKDELGVVPGLAVVLVGDRRDSATYVRSKKKACAEIGITSFGIDFPADVTEEALIAKVDELNANEAVHGILVQLPLPAHINERSVLDRISQEKDVDGLHPLNVAELANTKTHSTSGRSGFSFDHINFHVSCTPQGCIELLDRSGVTIEGKDAVVLGRSNIVGIPVALLLMQRNATVTIAHSRTKDIEAVVKRADIVVAAVGRTEMVKGEWIKPGAVVIDVGINTKDDPSDKRGACTFLDDQRALCAILVTILSSCILQWDRVSPGRGRGLRSLPRKGLADHSGNELLDCLQMRRVLCLPHWRDYLPSNKYHMGALSVSGSRRRGTYDNRHADEEHCQRCEESGAEGKGRRREVI